MKFLYWVVAFILILIYGCQNPENKPKTEEAKMHIHKEIFGKVYNQDIYQYQLTNPSGMKVKIINFGAIVTSIIVPDKEGNFNDVVLGFDKLDDYLINEPFFGPVVGRYANRIANGKFLLEGKEYDLATNNGPNHLHGGIINFSKVIWDAEEIQGDKFVGIELQYLSKDGEEEYPGNLDVTVVYTLTDKNELIIEYTAKTDQATPINLTHHSYFNLAGTSGKNILDHELFIDADKFVVVDETLIPTGELRDVAGTSMDFRKPATVGSRIAEVEGGYDHCYVLKNNSEIKHIAFLFDPFSMRKMDVYTTEPGVQFYSGNFLDGSLAGKNGIKYTKNFGLCLETQHFPDSPNQPSFPNTILRPGEKYEQTTIYSFSINQD
ncbi:MAG: galactose-1-epimerase [Bacteroidales bacterium]